jgi:hypothetical protein
MTGLLPHVHAVHELLPSESAIAEDSTLANLTKFA